MEQLNGFELAGRPMKVGNVTERTDLIQGPSLLDTDELDRSGIDLGATGRYVRYSKRKKESISSAECRNNLIIRTYYIVLADYS